MCCKFTGEHPCWSVISIELQSNFIEITLRHECSPVNLLYIFRISFTKNSCGRLLLTFFSNIECLCTTLSLLILCYAKPFHNCDTTRIVHLKHFLTTVQGYCIVATSPWTGCKLNVHKPFIVLDVFWTSYIRSVYVPYPEDLKSPSMHGLWNLFCNNRFDNNQWNK